LTPPFSGNSTSWCADRRSNPAPSDSNGARWTAYGREDQAKLVAGAGEIRRIYEDSAPPISSAMKPPARAFLADVVGIVKSGVEKAGGHFEVPKGASTASFAAPLDISGAWKV
jgi:hypothetical protein